jgi:hypothetical protein
MSDEPGPLISNEEMDKLCRDCLDAMNKAVGDLKDRIETLCVERVRERHPEIAANPGNFPDGLKVHNYPFTVSMYGLGCDIPGAVFWQFIRLNEVHDVVRRRLKRSGKKRPRDTPDK